MPPGDRIQASKTVTSYGFDLYQPGDLPVCSKSVHQVAKPVPRIKC